MVEDVTEYPALFGKDTNIIVVGGIKNNGERASYSQGTGDQLTVSAPGTVYCADGRGAGVSKISGTSFGWFSHFPLAHSLVLTRILSNSCACCCWCDRCVALPGRAQGPLASRGQGCCQRQEDGPGTVVCQNRRTTTCDLERH